MEILINGNPYCYETDIKDNKAIRSSFVNLAKQTFGINFEPWYQSGYWKKDYIPHVLLDHDKVVANISVNLMHLQWQGQEKCYIQLGTVMTDKNYRHCGLARWLMDEILSEWQSKCANVYLFANDQVLNFYPKFGFIEADEYQYILLFNGSIPSTRKLNMESPEDIELLKAIYKKGNLFSALSMTQNTGLLMFYCSQFMKDNVYYCDNLKVIIVADFEGDTMNCYDVYGGENYSFEKILNSVTRENTKLIKFGFTPLDNIQMTALKLKEEDTTLFLLKSENNIFKDNKLMLPVLSHA